MSTLLAVALTAFVCLTLGAFSNGAAYRNGFWDGVIWDRERAQGSYSYPSKPSSAWPLWKALQDGARLRDEKCSCARHRRCKTHGDL